MSEQDRINLYVAIMLLLVVSMLMYEHWTTRGELDYLHARVDRVDVRPVARILRAHDDATAEAVAREGTDGA